MPTSARLHLRPRIFFALLVSGWPALARAQRLVPDPTFTQPAIEYSVADSGFGTTVVAHPDRCVLVTTGAAYVDGHRVQPLIKINSDGTLDATFAPPTFAGFPSIVYVYADGRVLVQDGSSQILRLLPSGAIDPTYTRTRISSAFGVRAIALQDGRVLIWGSLSYIEGREARVGLLRADGGPDPTFAADVTPRDVAQQADGKLVIAGTVAWPDGSRRNMGRLNLDGSVDTTFDVRAALPSSDSGDSMEVVAALPDGKIVTANYLKVLRLLPSGALDPAYRPNLGYDSAPGAIGRVNASGTLYYLGRMPDATGTKVIPVLRRITPDGIVDPTFIVSGDALSSNEPRSLPVSWDERTFYIPGVVTKERAARRQLITRVDRNGTLDTSFGPRFSRHTQALSAVMRAPDGKYLIAGVFDYVNGVASTDSWVNFVRLNADGTLDRSFQPPPSVTESGTTTGVIPFGVQPDGRVLAQRDAGTWRLNVDGSRDTAFPAISVAPIGVARDGSFVVIELPDRHPARFLAEGVRDTSFNAATAPMLYSAMLASDGSVLFNTSGTIAPKIARLRPDGTLDPSYSVSPDFSRSSAFAPTADGGLLACGELSASAVRIMHFDATGRRTFWADTRSDFRTLAAALTEVVITRGGGGASIDLGNIQLGGRVDVRGDQVTLVPGWRDISFSADLMPMSRLRREAGGPAIFAPDIFAQPANRTFVAGGSATLSVQAMGDLDMTFQWFKNGAPFGEPKAGLGSSSLSLSNLQETDVGEYFVEVRNAAGFARSAVARLDLLSLRQEPPAAITVAAGQPFALTLNAVGENLRYRWLRVDGGVNRIIFDSLGSREGAPGIHTTYFPSATTEDSGVYRAIISGTGGGSISSREVVVTVLPNAEPGRLENVSVRSFAATGDQTLIVGFVIAGESGAGLPVLVRGAGPALAAFGIGDFLVNPRISLQSGQNVLAENDDWGGDVGIADVAARAGAFPFADARSRDAALYQPALAPGGYSVQISGAGNATGTALAEIYSLPARGARIMNLSCRAPVQPGNSLIAGFVVVGEAAQTVLVRGIGSGLTQFGVQGVLAKPELAVFDGSARTVVSSTRYPDDEIYTLASARTGAFALAGLAETNTAILTTLPPGAYTAQLRGGDSGGGIALIEIYELR